jgi:DHA1 family bicyclomycin/chloramphenicol resistance-like MFS transporter
MVIGMMSGAFVSSVLSHRCSGNRIIYYAFAIMVMAVLLNILQWFLFDPGVLNIIGPLVIYVFGLAMLMPAITIRALDCFPHNRGAAASMQGFFQMFINALVASIAVPLLHTKLEYFVFGQSVFLSIALLLWFLAQKATVSGINRKGTEFADAEGQ